MLKTYVAKNGKVIKYSALTYAITVYSSDNEQELVFTLMHPHFDDGIVRNIMGTYDRASRKAIKDFLSEELGIKYVHFARKDGTKHKRD